MGMENQRYMQEGLDWKRILLLMKGKLWLAAAAAVLGALAGGGLYLFIHLFFAAEREFQSVSKIYLNFNCDPEDFNELSYNGYTWNDLMATDPILGYTMEMLPPGTDRDAVIAATKAEILSDIRLLTITVTANEPEAAAQIMEATQKSLVHLGETDELFESIRIYSTGEPRQIVWDNRTANAAATGAVLGGVLALLALAFYYVLDDSFYVAADLEKRFGLPVLGLFVPGGTDGLQAYGKEFAVNYRYLCRDVKTAVLACVEDGTDLDGIGCAMRKAAEDGGKSMENRRDAENGESAAGETGTAESAGTVRTVELTGTVRTAESTGTVRTAESTATVRTAEPAATVRTAEPAGREAAGLPQLEIGGNLAEDMTLYRRIREKDGAILCLCYGRRNGKLLEAALSNLKKQDCRVLGAVIVHADEKFLKFYFCGKKKGTGK